MVNFDKKEFGPELRLQYQNNELKNTPIVPNSVEYEDIDRAFFHYFEENLVNTSGTKNSETESIVCVQPDNVSMYKLDLSNADGDVRCFFFREDGNTIKEYKYSSGNVYYIEVPESAEGLSFCLVVDDVLYSASLTEYLPKN
jgi:hypothetical protein